mmetsp:Transcript_36766/g.82845  ORF Transcript_36766/g.82845 Transcript_36766/m.82845 type:complete len:101 (-) Transcript_36766:32-334(-)
MPRPCRAFLFLSSEDLLSPCLQFHPQRCPYPLAQQRLFDVEASVAIRDQDDEQRLSGWKKHRTERIDGKFVGLGRIAARWKRARMEAQKEIFPVLHSTLS